MASLIKSLKNIEFYSTQNPTEDRSSEYLRLLTGAGTLLVNDKTKLCGHIEFNKSVCTKFYCRYNHSERLCQLVVATLQQINPSPLASVPQAAAPVRRLNINAKPFVPSAPRGAAKDEEKREPMDQAKKTAVQAARTLLGTLVRDRSDDSVSVLPDTTKSVLDEPQLAAAFTESSSST